MIMLFRFLFKNIIEKKLRSILIILAIAITTAMTFASFGTSDNFKNMLIEKNKMEFGSADLLIKNQDDADSPYINQKEIDKILIDNDKVGIYNGNGIFKDKNNTTKINIVACEINDLQKINPVILSSESSNFNLNNLTGDNIIISKEFAKKFNLKLGDVIEIKTDGRYIDFKIEAFAAPKGLLSEKPGESTVIVNNKSFFKLLGREPEVTSYLVESKNNKSIVKNEIENEVKGIKVLETISDKTLDDMVNQFTIPFYIMLVVVMLMASFIIYSSFKIIVIERMQVIGTLRSIGATKFSTDMFLIFESLIYGIIGCTLGGFLGLPMLYILSDSSNQFKDYGINTVVSFSNKNLIIAIIISMIILIASSLIPIIQAGRISIKQIVLGEYSKYSKQHPVIAILGLGFVIFPFYYITKYPNSSNFILTVLCAFLLLVGVSIILPYFLIIICKFLSKVYGFVFGNVGFLAIENVSKSKNLISNCVLLCCALAAVTTIFIASYSVKNIITNGFANTDYDVSISSINKSNEESVYKELDNFINNDIKGYYNNYQTYNIEIYNKDMNIGVLQGINNKKYLDYFPGEKITNGKNENDQNAVINKLNTGRYIILADLFEKKYKYKVGDEIKLKLDNKEYKYEILGFLSSPISSNKRNCLISEENFKKDLNIKIPEEILIKSNNISKYELITSLNNSFEDYGVTIRNKDDIEKTEIENNSGVMNSLESFSIMALVIGSLGIVNNFMVSFIQRKRELAVLASIGMSKTQRMKMIILEGFTVGIVGSILGVTTGILISKFIPEITLSLNTYLMISIPKDQVILLLILGILLMLASSFIPMIKSSKISIVKEIKYE